jgi:type I restriction enzyme S subunit
MSKGWQTKALGELCEIELGKTPARANASFWDAERETSNVWLSIADLLKAEDNVVVDSKEYVSDKGAAICKLVPKGTLLVSFKLTLGRLAFAGRDLFTNEAIAALTIFNERELSKEFLFYCLTFFDWVKAAESDVKLKGMTLNKAKLKVMPVSFPPLAEQQRIVSLLDEAFEGLATAKANAEKNLQNARALFESHLQSVFTRRSPGWVEKSLGAVAEVQSGGTPSVPEKTYWGGKIPWYSSGELNEIHTTDPERTITDAGLSNSNAKLFPKGSLLIGMYDTAALKMSILDRDGTFNQAIAGVKPNERVEVEFVLHAINAVKPRLLLERRGVRQKNLSLGKIKEIAIPIPPPTAQRAVVSSLRNVVAETQRLARLYERKHAALEALEKSLLHQAFTGEL